METSCKAPLVTSAGGGSAWAQGLSFPSAEGSQLRARSVLHCQGHPTGMVAPGQGSWSWAWTGLATLDGELVVAHEKITHRGLWLLGLVIKPGSLHPKCEVCVLLKEQKRTK